mmetsp:Transcript_6180/g.9319  ORF Transcript_6180/g.9319 Transcript_6180/m.9319 type:complete len:639 (+) Transcript_6180:56-1972(+)
MSFSPLARSSLPSHILSHPNSSSGVYDNDSSMSHESDIWETCIENIPLEIQDEYAPVVAGLTLNTRINLYKILDSLDYTLEYCTIVLTTLNTVKQYIETFINYTIQLDVSRRPLFFYFCCHLKEKHLSDLLTVISYDLVYKLMELAYYLDKKELTLMLELIHELTIEELDVVINLSDEPLAKHCRLCRSKRLYAMEYRLHNSQVDEIHANIPGMASQYEKADVWRADNDGGLYTFNYERGVIMWRKEIVDLVRICDTCLHEVHAANSNVARFEPIHHLEGYAKKEMVTEIRAEERRRAELTGRLAKEQVRRRAREWAMRALKTQREGYAQEKREEQQIEEAIAKDMAFQEEQEEKNKTLNLALSVDKSWVQHEDMTQRTRNKNRFDYAELKWMPRFGPSNPCPPVREHPHSWRLTAYGGKGGDLPVDPVAVTKRFGTGDFSPDIRTAELTMWKQQSQYLHKLHLDRVAAEERAAAKARAKETAELNQFVADKFYQFGRKEKQRLREAEQAEEDRLIARKEARDARRAARLAREEAKARKDMCGEDRRSWRMRYYEHECREIERERQDMSAEEEMQTKIDKFWGVPTAIRDAKNAMNRKQQKLQAASDELRRLSMQVKILRPYKSEHGQFRDLHGRIIT